MRRTTARSEQICTASLDRLLHKFRCGICKSIQGTLPHLCFVLQSTSINMLIAPRRRRDREINQSVSPRNDWVRSCRVNHLCCCVWRSFHTYVNLSICSSISRLLQLAPPAIKTSNHVSSHAYRLLCGCDFNCSIAHLNFA